MLGAAKHQRHFFGVLGKVFAQQRRLVALRGEMHGLGDLVGNFARRRNLHSDGFGQVGLRQLLHQFRHGGRKQHGLTARRQQFRDLAQRVNEAEVKHLVGLVQHQILSVFKG
ncbi:hypothetical protein GALL_535420 [mine drainage metagenome]|uniref:Uncharacterized protein n=1 Tax=mine drainage metagenome TaxID=410659 RepID=A0A1J5P033_9ZZZZ